MPADEGRVVAGVIHPGLLPTAALRVVGRHAHPLQRRLLRAVKFLQDHTPVEDRLNVVRGALPLAPGHLPAAQPEIELTRLWGGAGWGGRGVFSYSGGAEMTKGQVQRSAARHTCSRQQGCSNYRLWQEEVHVNVLPARRRDHEVLDEPFAGGPVQRLGDADQRGQVQDIYLPADQLRFSV